MKNLICGQSSREQRRKILTAPAFRELADNLEDKANVHEMKNCSRHQVIRSSVVSGASEEQGG